jgi:hypothetical protein
LMRFRQEKGGGLIIFSFNSINPPRGYGITLLD